MDEIRTRLAEIKVEGEKALAELEGADRVAKLKELKAERDGLLAQLAEAKETEELAAEVTAEVDPGEEKEEEAEEAPEPEAKEEVVEEATDAEALALAAAAKPVDQRVPEESAAAADSNPGALIAAAGVGSINPGIKLDADAIQTIHRHAGRNEPGKGQTVRSVFGRMSTNLSDRRGPSGNYTAEDNTSIMASAGPRNQDAITAAAAFCGPPDVVLDICSSGETERPIQSLFSTSPVRGEFIYMKSATLADVAPGVNIWEVDDQEAVDPDDSATWKPCVDLSCRTTTTVTPHAVVGCATIGVWQQLSAPEQIANWLQKMDVQYARIAETRLADRIRAQSKVYSAGSATGTVSPWNLLNALLAYAKTNIAAVLRSTMEGYVLLVPYGFTSVLAADLALRGFSSNLTTSDIANLLQTNYGITLREIYETDSTVSASFRTGATELLGMVDGAAAIPFDQDSSAPDTWPVYLLRPSAFRAGESDVVDFGYFRDANLVRQNLVRYFGEGMEYLEKVCEDLAFTWDLNTCVNGKATALVDGPDCAGNL